MAPHKTSLRRSSRILAATTSSSILKETTGMSSTRLQNLKLSSTSPSNSDAEASSSRRPAKRMRTGVQSETTETEAHALYVVSNDHIKDTRTKTKSKTIKMQQRGIKTEFDDVHNKRTSKTKGKDKAKANDPVPEDFPPRGSSLWRVGPHVSAAGGVENAVYNAASLGATAFALFLKSQRKWSSAPLTDDNVVAFKRRLREFGYEPKHVLPHGNYLVNLGNPDTEKREKSYECFLDDLKRCELLGLFLYNFHPGSTVGQAATDVSLSLIAQSLNRAHKETSSVVTVIENMAGAGNVLGSKFKELGKIIHEVEDKSRVGVCLDTCHMFAAGYDIRTKDGWNKTMAEFEREVGLQYLRGMHLNDSKETLNSRKDRHENIGQGLLGLHAFLHILTDPRTQDIPLILETPAHQEGKSKSKNFGDGWEVWKKEVEVLKRLSDADVDPTSKSETRMEAWAAEVRAVVLKRGGEEAKYNGGVKSKKEKAGKRKREEDEEDDDSCCGDD